MIVLWTEILHIQDGNLCDCVIWTSPIGIPPVTGLTISCMSTSCSFSELIVRPVWIEFSGLDWIVSLNMISTVVSSPVSTLTS